MCDGNLSMANSIEDEDNPFEGPFENCPECLNGLSDIEYDLQYCDSCGWQEARVETACPECGHDLDEVDFDYQICSRCGWDGNIE